MTQMVATDILKGLLNHSSCSLFGNARLRNYLYIISMADLIVDI